YFVTATDINGDGRTDFISTPNPANNNIVLTTNAVNPTTVIFATNTVVEATGPSGAVVTFSTSATNWSGTVPTTNTPPSGSTFPLGTNTVTATAHMLITTFTNKTFTITVQDTTKPALTLIGANRMTNFVNNYTDPGATASDIVAGNLTGSINVSGLLDTST